MAGRIAHRTNVGGTSGPYRVVFPLRKKTGGRYLETAEGFPFLINGDTPWSIEAQLTTAQIDTYLANRVAKGFNAILFEYMEHKFSSQTPAYRNANGDDPFNPMTDFASPVTAYMQHVQYIVAKAAALGVICFITPCYMSVYGAGSEGWATEMNAETDADLSTFGSYLQTNLGIYNNVVWVMGGDDNDATRITKNLNILNGIRSVKSDVLWTGHGARPSEAYAYWTADSYFINNIYTDGTEYDDAATAYGRSGPYPFVLIEGYYENENGQTDADLRRQAYASILSGACGHFFGNNPVWGFGEPNVNGGNGPAYVIANNLNSTVQQHMAHVPALFTAYAWQKLQPKTDTSLVTTSLGSGTTRICPALASDGSFAMVWKSASGAFTVNMSALTPSSVRARWYNTTDGSFSTDGASPLANTGTHEFTAAGERVLVLDAA